MCKSPFSTSKLLQRAAALSKILIRQPRCCYYWGKYDVNPGQCCKMRDAATTECTQKKMICKLKPFPNLCYKKINKSAVLTEQYPQHLWDLSRPKDPICDLVRSDVCLYEPSDKTRRYQRTWPECPMIWLRPKKICCPDKEHYPVARRRRLAPKPPLTKLDKHAFQMELLCRQTRMRSKQKLKCHIVRDATDCKKIPPPFPSFSECDAKCIQRYCPTECACNVRPSLCEIWRIHRRNHGILKSCTDAAVNCCTYRNRSRPLF